ncbi:MAG: hypothetical protein HY315_05695 [Acidobacteria bacterium]|nr:hypothetical protein [Acidobacteriota bacterium]
MCRQLYVILLLGAQALVALQAQDAGKKVSEKDLAREKALAVIQQSIESMGGNKFRQVRAMQSKGHYYTFKRGQIAGIDKYTDHTRLPDKSRFQLGDGKNKEVTIFDLAAGKGWHLEGKEDIKEATADEMKLFRQAAQHSIDNLLRHRLEESGMTFFYYAPGAMSGKSDLEAVEMIDAENDSMLIYFDLKTHFPARLEYTTLEGRGSKRKEATEFSMWHSIGGVMTPLRFDNFLEGELASQAFVDEIVYNSPAALGDSTFARPAPEK